MIPRKKSTPETTKPPERISEAFFMERQNALALQSCEGSQTFLLRENSPLRQRNRPSTHRSIPPIFPEHGRLAAAAFETSEKGATADTIVSGGRKANAEARANALQRGLMRIMGRSDGKTRSRNGGGHRATKTPDAEAPGVLEWGVWRCSTFTGNTTDYHRR